MAVTAVGDLVKLVVTVEGPLQSSWMAESCGGELFVGLVVQVSGVFVLLA
jgi:hypothetical protein